VVHFEHGKVGFRWCDTCGTLILGSKCDVCSSTGRRFEVSKPADLRPAMGRTMDLLASLFERYFGTSHFLKNRLVFLNKVAGEDRTDEVVFQGTVIATLRYDLRARDFALDLKLDGARLLAALAFKGVVVMGHDTGHLKGKSFPGSAFAEIKGPFRAGDPLIVLAGNLICSGVAKVDSDAFKGADKAVGVRDVGKGRVEVSKHKASWTGFVNANETYFKALESKAVSDIRSYAGEQHAPPSPSRSAGGKDVPSLLRAAVPRRAEVHPSSSSTPGWSSLRRCAT